MFYLLLFSTPYLAAIRSHRGASTIEVKRLGFHVLVQKQARAYGTTLAGEQDRQRRKLYASASGKNFIEKGETR